MFEPTDNFLIEKSQWCIHWLEITTGITRKTIGYALQAINVTLLFANFFLASFVLYFSIKNSIGDTMSLVLFVISFCVWQLYSQILSKKLLNKEPKIGVFPKEIDSRFSVRFLCIVITLTMSLTFSQVLAYTIGLPTSQEDARFLAEVFLCVLIMTPWIILMFEYLYCTTSLPPGEKERMKREKEMRKGVLIKN